MKSLGLPEYPMNATQPLSAEQIASFKENGYLILEGLIEPAYIDAWRRRFWDVVGGDEHDPATWKSKDYVTKDLNIPLDQRLDAHPRLRAIVNQLGGGNFDGSGGIQPLVHWPQDTTAWRMTSWGHVDGYPPGSWYPFMLAATTYLYDVEPMGGAFIYWPKSHLTTQRYFLENPDDIDGRFRERIHNFNWGGPNEFTRRAPEPPREFIARAGDVILWHSFLIHTGSANIRPSPRVGFFARYHHLQQDTFKHEVPENLWKYWAV